MWVLVAAAAIAVLVFLIARRRKLPDRTADLGRMLQFAEARRERKGQATPSKAEQRLRKAMRAVEPQQETAAAGAPFETPPINREIGLVYHDRGDHVTERLVTVHVAHGIRARDGKPHIVSLGGYCHTKKAPRTFRVSRITRAYEPGTGEVIDDLAQWLGVSGHR